MTPKRATVIRTLERNGASSALTVSTHAASNVNHSASNAATAIKGRDISSGNAERSSRASKDHEKVVDYINQMRGRRQSNPLEYSFEGLHAKQKQKEKTLRNG